MISFPPLTPARRGEEKSGAGWGETRERERKKEELPASLPFLQGVTFWLRATYHKGPAGQGRSDPPLTSPASLRQILLLPARGVAHLVIKSRVLLARACALAQECIRPAPFQNSQPVSGDDGFTANSSLELSFLPPPSPRFPGNLSDLLGGGGGEGSKEQ